MILSDIGNTSTKFFINNEIKNYFKDDEIPKFNDEIFYISVNEKAEKKLLEKNPNAKDLSTFIDFKTLYKGMGIDRVVASSFQKDAVIIDAGSAITVDIIENFVHKGGYIFLGVDSFLKAYENISPLLKIDRSDFEKNINLDNSTFAHKTKLLFGMNA